MKWPLLSNRCFFNEKSELFPWWTRFRYFWCFARTSTKKSLRMSNRLSEAVNRRTGKINEQKKRDKWTNNDLQNITQKTKDRATRTPLKTGMNPGASEWKAVPIFIIYIRLKIKPNRVRIRF